MECLNCSLIRTPTTTVSGGGRFQEDLHFGERFFRIVGKSVLIEKKCAYLAAVGIPWLVCAQAEKNHLGQQVVSNANLDVGGFG